MSNILNQYRSLKEKHPEAILLFRCGDFYESYEDDAEAVANTLHLTLTTNRTSGIRFCGFPHHALDAYLPRLVRTGKRVAICDQLEEQKQKPKTSTVILPVLTRKQYDILCECIRYRSADNDKERSDAFKRGNFTAWYDEMSVQLTELKSLIYNK